MSKLLASLMRNYFPKRPSGAPLHTLPKIIWCSCWFWTPPPLFWGWIFLILRSPKGGCCSISDDLSCFRLNLFCNNFAYCLDSNCQCFHLVYSKIINMHLALLMSLIVKLCFCNMYPFFLFTMLICLSSLYLSCFVLIGDPCLTIYLRGSARPAAILYRPTIYHLYFSAVT